jgi:hypothetical protein
MDEMDGDGAVSHASLKLHRIFFRLQVHVHGAMDLHFWRVDGCFLHGPNV